LLQRLQKAFVDEEKAARCFPERKHARLEPFEGRMRINPLRVAPRDAGWVGLAALFFPRDIVVQA